LVLAPALIIWNHRPQIHCVNATTAATTFARQQQVISAAQAKEALSIGFITQSPPENLRPDHRSGARRSRLDLQPSEDSHLIFYLLASLPTRDHQFSPGYCDRVGSAASSPSAGYIERFLFPGYTNFTQNPALVPASRARDCSYSKRPALRSLELAKPLETASLVDTLRRLWIQCVRQHDRGWLNQFYRIHESDRNQPSGHSTYRFLCHHSAGTPLHSWQRLLRLSMSRSQSKPHALVAHGCKPRRHVLTVPWFTYQRLGIIFWRPAGVYILVVRRWRCGYLPLSWRLLGPYWANDVSLSIP